MVECRKIHVNSIIKGTAVETCVKHNLFKNAKW